MNVYKNLLTSGQYINLTESCGIQEFLILTQRPFQANAWDLHIFHLL